MSQGSRNVIIAAFLANLAIMISKFVAAWMSGSTAILAEGLHSLADTGNQALLFVGLWLSHRPADAGHPFGYGKENFFWAFVVAVTMFVVGAVVSIWQGVEKLLQPHELESMGVALGVLVASIVFEGTAFTYAFKHIRGQLRGETIWQFIRHSKEPASITVLMEDSAALTGLLIAIVGLLIAHFTGIALFDGLASICIGLLLALVAVVLSVETKSLLVGESASPADMQRIREAMQNTVEVTRVLDLRTMHLGPDKVLVAAKLHLTDGLETDAIELLLDRIEADVKNSCAFVEHCYLEVDRPKA